MKTALKDPSAISYKYKITESAETAVGGIGILGKVEGTFFVPDGISRNKRFYPRSLWEKVLSDVKVKAKMTKRLMFGTIGHDVEIDDKAIREGIVSHITTAAYINEAGQGIGSALILDTPVGQILNKLLRAGCELFISSRANGDCKGQYQGMPVVNEENYDLIGWDFVLEAGFLEANPRLVESLSKNDLNFLKSNETILNKETNSMSDPAKLNEALVQKTLDENTDLKKEVKRLTEEKEVLKADKDAADKEAADMAKEKEESDKKVEALEADVKAKEDELEKANGELKEYQEIGDSPEDVKESLEISLNTMNKIKEEFGSVEAIRESLTTATNFKKMIDEEFGGVEQIREALGNYKKIMEEQEQAAADKQADDLAKELNIDVAQVKELLAKNSPDEIRKMYSSVAEALKANGSSFVKKPVTIVEGANKVDEGLDAEAGRLKRVNANW